MSRFVTRFGWLTGTLMVLGSPTLALAQGNIFNPYGNSGYSDYREFGSPKYSTDPGLPGQSRVGTGVSGSRYNTFDEFTSSLDGGTDGRSVGVRSYSGMPFYRAYQLEAQQARRSVRPTENADQAYRQRLAERNNLYFRALNSSDPKERARLLREVERLTARDSVDRPPGLTPAPRAPQAANRTAPAAPALAPAPPTARPTPSPTRPTAPSRPAPSPTTAPPVAPTAPGVAPAPPAPTTNPGTSPAPTSPGSVPVPAPG